MRQNKMWDERVKNWNARVKCWRDGARWAVWVHCWVCWWTCKKEGVVDRWKEERTPKEKLLLASIMLFEVHYFTFPSWGRERDIYSSHLSENFLQKTFSNKTSGFYLFISKWCDYPAGDLWIFGEELRKTCDHLLSLSTSPSDRAE